MSTRRQKEGYIHALLRESGIACSVWFEYALAHHGVPTVLFNLHILVDNIDAATEALIKRGWVLKQQGSCQVGNATLQSTHYCLFPPDHA